MNRGKVIFLLILVWFVGKQANAQRFAYVDTEYILNQMPEYKSAQKQIDLMVLEWKKEIENTKKEIATMRNNLEAEKVFLTDEMRKKREEEIERKEKELRDFQSNKFSPNGELYIKRQELIKPIQDKIYDAIQRVVKDNALDFIFDRSSSVTMLYANVKYDRSDEVLEVMGVLTSPDGTATKKKDSDSDEQNEEDDLKPKKKNR